MTALPTTRRELQSLLRADLYRYGGSRGVKAFLRRYRRNPGFRYTFWMRLAGYLHQHRPLRPIYWLVNQILRRTEHKFEISIPWNARIGPGLYVGHYGGIFVHEHACIGRNCNLSQGVMIGQTNRGERRGVPTLGNSVYVARSQGNRQCSCRL